MALRVHEFFGFTPLDPRAKEFVNQLKFPFVNQNCIKPRHGACSVQQISAEMPVICCPNRMYGENFKILKDIAKEVFGPKIRLTKASDFGKLNNKIKSSGNVVIVFGKYWGKELPLPKPPGIKGAVPRNFYMDWILARISPDGEVFDFTAIEVQTIDTTGSYIEQSNAFFKGEEFIDSKGRTPGYSDSGINWENVNKRILPQLIYKGHVLRREKKCTKGLYFVCPEQVVERIKERLGGGLHRYEPQPGAITIRSYIIGKSEEKGGHKKMIFSSQFTTTVDQIAVAFTSPRNLPEMNVYEAAIKANM